MIKLNCIISDKLFCSNVGMARAASQRLFSRNKSLFRFFYTMCSCFRIFSNQQKRRIEMLRRDVQIAARELRSETISCIFGRCPYQNNPRLSWSLLYMRNFEEFIQVLSWLHFPMPQHMNVLVVCNTYEISLTSLGLCVRLYSTRRNNIDILYDFWVWCHI